MVYFPVLTELLFDKPYIPNVADREASATFDGYKDSPMGFPVTAYIVFVDHADVGPHAPRFKTMDEAEKFANDLRAIAGHLLTVSEPIPEIATENINLPKCLQD